MSFKFGVFTGPRISSTDPGHSSYTRVSNAIAAFDAAGTAFNVCLGDYFNASLDEANQRIAAANLGSILTSVSTPCYCGLGNHSSISPKADLFTLIGAANASRSCTSWDIGINHFIIIPRFFRGNYLSGSVTVDVTAEEWLKGDIYDNRGKRTIIFSGADLEIDRVLANIVNRYASTQLFIAGERRNDSEQTFFGIETKIIRDIEMAGSPYYIGEIDDDDFTLTSSAGTPTRTFTFPSVTQRLNISSTSPGITDKIIGNVDVTIRGSGFGFKTGTVSTVSRLGVATEQTITSWKNDEINVSVTGLHPGVYDIKVVSYSGVEGYAYESLNYVDTLITRQSSWSEVYSRTESSFCVASSSPIGELDSEIFFVFISFTSFKTHIYKFSSDFTSAAEVAQIANISISSAFGSDRLYIVDRSGWNLYTFDGSNLINVISTKPAGVGFCSSVVRVHNDTLYVSDGTTGNIYSWDKTSSEWTLNYSGPGSISAGIPCISNGNVYLIKYVTLGSTLYKWNGSGWDTHSLDDIVSPGDLIENENGIFVLGKFGVFKIDLIGGTNTQIFPTYECGIYGQVPKFVNTEYLVTGRELVDRSHGTGTAVLAGHIIRFNGQDSYVEYAEALNDQINGFVVGSIIDSNGNAYLLNNAYDRKGITVNRGVVSTIDDLPSYGTTTIHYNGSDVGPIYLKDIGQRNQLGGGKGIYTIGQDRYINYGEDATFVSTHDVKLSTTLGIIKRFVDSGSLSVTIAPDS